jgi:hypothetical protein
MSVNGGFSRRENRIVETGGPVTAIGGLLIAH